jgi:hypothetical protein
MKPVSVVRLRNLLISHGCQVVAQPDLLHVVMEGLSHNNDWLASFRSESAKPCFSSALF